ncbi:cupin domain-containing protein [Marinobacter nanhaiticus D15-8W]|uniref:Cupin domain-containing protein n=1 Tax=Marinobacter nanhaiticus D15-8W TaxID=626887 RepID=N6WY88_9GAMM|nr:cupin domain-containing protein [Marinobacter nanhaiticus]ENO13728.1 cupin domain-containing protein [Marinobacter nanhaiticus D15-8W]BES71101.1 cupin domain-containing protein [Marinobacter nanhaiticus D15-8W]
MQIPGGLDAAVFLRDYWQKKPLLVRQAFPDLVSPVSPDELGGLACESAVESRIVIENDHGRPWQLENGPFEPERFENLPPTHWTLLIQGLDHWVPELSPLLDRFRFVPNWRLDDIMASYAPEGGSVGPHYDQYDVFLIQAQGRREWQFGGECNEDSPRVEGTPLRILKEWEGEETRVLEPGDMLYLPPGIGHHGVALDDCITLSVGFRAPSHDDILTGFSDFLCNQPGAERLLRDPELQLQDNPGLISDASVDGVARIVEEALGQRDLLALWLGQYTTAPKSNDIVAAPEDPIDAGQLVEALEAGEVLRWNEGSRFAYRPVGDQVALFVDGERFMLGGDAQAIAPVLCSGSEPNQVELRRLAEDPALAGLLVTLFNHGSLYIDWS